MLTVAECRALMGPDAPETDADVEALRDLLYTLSSAALEIAAKEAAEAKSGGEEP